MNGKILSLRPSGPHPDAPASNDRGTRSCELARCTGRGPACEIWCEGCGLYVCAAHPRVQGMHGPKAHRLAVAGRDGVA